MARDMFSEGKAPVVVTIAVAPGKAGAREALLGVLAQVKYVVLEKR
jgi:hypothetical protein